MRAQNYKKQFKKGTFFFQKMPFSVFLTKNCNFQHQLLINADMMILRVNISTTLLPCGR